MLKRDILGHRVLGILAVLLLVSAGVASYFVFVANDSEGEEDGVRVKEIALARSVTPGFVAEGLTFTFPTNARQIWALVSLENVAKDVTVTGFWSYLGPTGQADPVKLAEASVKVDVDEALFDEQLEDDDPKTPDLSRRSSLSLNKQTDFDAGIYELKVFLDERQAKVLQFNVVPPSQISSGSATAAPATATATARPAGSTTPAPTATVAPTATRPPAVTPQQSIQGAVATPTATAVPTEEPTQTPIPTATTIPGTYIVKPGETLAGIAGQLGVSVDLLASANNITNPSAISAGQVLVIPTPPPSR